MNSTIHKNIYHTITSKTRNMIVKMTVALGLVAVIALIWKNVNHHKLGSETISYTVKAGDNLFKILKAHNIDQEYLPTVIELNKLNEEGTIHPGDTLLLPDLSDGDNSHDDEKIERGNNDNPSYTKLSSLDDIKNAKDYLAKKACIDTGEDKNGFLRIGTQIKNAIGEGYTVYIPKDIETKNSPSLSIDDITAPQEILGKELQGKTFVLDPGHGSADPGAIGIAQYGDEKNKEKVLVYEAPVVMDITYRIAQLIRAHGGKVVFTHYAHKRGIMNQKDLSPVSRIMINGEEAYQDIWHNAKMTDYGDIRDASGKYLKKRGEIGNNISNATLFISFHADIEGKDKVLSIRYQSNENDSKQIADLILKNGFSYTYNGKTANDVNYSVKGQGLKVLKTYKKKGILVELGNLGNTNQAYILRNHEKRQELARNFVEALIKSL